MRFSSSGGNAEGARPPRADALVMVREKSYRLPCLDLYTSISARFFQRLNEHVHFCLGIVDSEARTRRSH